jgi:N-acetylneuraminate lyase
MTDFGGLWPAMLTPLDAAGRPDAAGIERLVEWFVEQGLDGLYILGSTGQWPLLDLEGRRLAAERVVRVAAGRIKVMVHVGAVATDDAVSLARHAATIGADAVSCVAPIYYPAGPDVTFEHYRRIGAASELPLFVYHLSLVNQVALDPREYVERLLAVPRIAGMKITDRDLYQFGLIRAYGGDRLRLFSGADEVMCHAALAGAVGAIGTFYNVWGRACQLARREFVAGSFESGRRFMLVFQQAIHQALQPPGVWSFLRAAVRLKSGVDVGMPRPPLGTLDQPWPEAEVERLVGWVDGA